MTSLLISEPPLQVLPTLAKEIGLNEAIVLQQLHYWTLHTKDPERWIYNTIEEWQKQFPFWSPDTIKRTWKSLADSGMVETSQRRGNDRTKSYRVVYNKIPRGHFATLENAPLQEGKTPPCIGSTETTQRSPIPPEGDLPPVPRKKVARKQVTEAEWAMAHAIIPTFNAVAGTAYKVEAHLVKVVGRVREYPDLTAEQHREIIEVAFADPHWTGHPSPAVVYGNAAIFEKYHDQWRAKGRGGTHRHRPTTDVNAERKRLREQQGLPT